MVMGWVRLRLAFKPEHRRNDSVAWENTGPPYVLKADLSKVSVTPQLPSSPAFQDVAALFPGPLMGACRGERPEEEPSLDSVSKPRAADPGAMRGASVCVSESAQREDHVSAVEAEPQREPDECKGLGPAEQPCRKGEEMLGNNVPEDCEGGNCTCLTSASTPTPPHSPTPTMPSGC